MNRRRRPGVHGGMNRPDQYIAQLTAQAAWLRAQGDEESAALAEELADRFNTRHEGVLDVTTPEWANEAEGEVIDAAPSIRCWPSPGVVISGPGGKVLTIDPMDGGDVAVVHLGDIIGWVESVHMARVAKATVDVVLEAVSEDLFEHDGCSKSPDSIEALIARVRAAITQTRSEANDAVSVDISEAVSQGFMTAAGNLLDDLAERMGAADDDVAHDLATDLARVLRERHGAAGDTWVVEHIPARSGEDAERAAYDATVGVGYEVGEVIDAEFEVTPDEVIAAQEAADPFNIDPPPGYGDVAALQARDDDHRDYHARLLADANDSDWEETIGAVETAAAADDVSDRDIEHELDAQADEEDDL